MRPTGTCEWAHSQCASWARVLRLSCSTDSWARTATGAAHSTGWRTELFVTYRLADPSVSELLLVIRRVAETRLAEVAKITRAFLAENAQLDPVDAEDLRARVRNGEVTLLDVRPEEEFATGHIPGALSVPLPALAKRLSDLPKRREVVAYCRGPYCVLAVEAVKLLRARGFKAVRLEDGILDWASHGLKIADSRG